jgi:hypothetical protein
MLRLASSDQPSEVTRRDRLGGLIHETAWRHETGFVHPTGHSADLKGTERALSRARAEASAPRQIRGRGPLANSDDLCLMHLLAAEQRKRCAGFSLPAAPARKAAEQRPTRTVAREIDAQRLCAADGLGMPQSLRALAALVESELGCRPEDIFPELDHGGSRDLEDIADKSWSALALLRPELFASPVDPSKLSGLAIALYHARAENPGLIAALTLRAKERQMLHDMRARLIAWSEVPTWTDFDHLVFAPECVLLAETYALTGHGGIAFTFHPRLDHIALYPREAIASYRRHSSACLISVLLHEEAHLAVALLIPGISGPHTEEALQRFENGARLVQHVSYLTLRDGRVPEHATLVAFLERCFPETARFVDELGEPSVPDLVAAGLTEALRALDRPHLVCRAPDLLIRKRTRVSRRGDLVDW